MDVPRRKMKKHFEEEGALLLYANSWPPFSEVETPHIPLWRALAAFATPQVPRCGAMFPDTGRSGGAI
jgi:hypothetical protein